MKKRKIFKTLAFSSLALVMAAGGIFAFAPIGASASAPPPTTTTGLGLDPKNDPVVYTTESGLEIKMSNADKFSGTVTATTNRGASYTQDLTSFYYFTMGSYSGTIYTGEGGSTTASYTCTNEPVNWIILGVGSHSTAFVESVSNYLFSTIKNNDYLFSNGEYYFDNQHETFSPAGQLIDSTISAKTYIMGKVKDSIVVNTEIPKGCMLVLSEKLLGQMYFNSSGAVNYYCAVVDPIYQCSGSGVYGNRYRYIGQSSTTGIQSWTTSGNAGGSTYNYINNLFSKDVSGTILSNSLNFTSTQSSLIIPQQLYTCYYDGSNYMQETPSTDGGTYYSMFPLACKAANTSIVQNFCYENYLTETTQRVATFIGSTQSYTWRLRSGAKGSSSYSSFVPHILASGECYTAGAQTVQNSVGIRPAMVMKLQ